MDFVIHAHSGLRWLLLLAIVIILFFSFAKRSTKIPLSNGERLIMLSAVILMHLQILLGFILYFGNKRYEGFGQMDVPILRFLAIEHMLGMIIAAILLTIGYKKTTDTPEGKMVHNTMFLWFAAAFLVILISIPWPFRGNGFDYFGYF